MERSELRAKNKERVSQQFAQFRIQKISDRYVLHDDDIGKAVSLMDNFEVGLATNESFVIGKLISIHMSDVVGERRLATVQISGLMTFIRTRLGSDAVGSSVMGYENGGVTMVPQPDIRGRGIVLDVDNWECTVYMP